MGLPAAIAGSAVAGLAGSALSANAAQSAAQTQANAATTASNNALAQYNQTRADLAPFTNAGTSALASLEATLGLGNTTGTPGTNMLTTNGLSGLTFQPTQAQLAATPGYQFDLSQGLQGVYNSNAATGNGVSGNALKGAASYATGLANNTLTTQQGIFQQNLGNVLNPLTNLVGTGQNSAATVGQQGIQATGNANNALIGGANATAAGTVGTANAINSGLSGLGSSGTNYLLYNQLLNGNAGSSATPYDPQIG
jgi:hypothetical protein